MPGSFKTGDPFAGVTGGATGASDDSTSGGILDVLGRLFDPSGVTSAIAGGAENAASSAAQSVAAAARNTIVSVEDTTGRALTATADQIAAFEHATGQTIGAGLNNLGKLSAQVNSGLYDLLKAYLQAQGTSFGISLPIVLAALAIGAIIVLHD